MRIAFQKISDARHVLEILRADGRRERVECETRSYLAHDFLHFAVETEARLGGGFWGNLARGKTLADMNDRTGQAMRAEAPEMAGIERVVGALSAAAKGMPGARVIAALQSYAESLDAPLPQWLTESLVVAVQGRMKQLVGRWKATPYGGQMELEWSA
jgi:hypothetical protein